MTLRSGHEVEMFEEKNCQMTHEESVQATYDAKTHMGPWAYLCEACFEMYTPGVTGIGRGQELVYPGDPRLEGEGGSNERGD